MTGLVRIAAGLGAAALLAGCATKPAPAPPAATPVRAAPSPVQVPPPPREPVSQQDSPDPPLAPGDWSYSEERSGSVARFGLDGAERFSLRCDPFRREILFSLGPEQPALRVRTSFGERAVPAGARLPASDPLLDEMAFSRGRFTVEAEGRPALILPTWPEPARVVEDCRG